MQKLRYEHFLAENTVKNVYHTMTYFHMDPWKKKFSLFFLKELNNWQK